MYACCFCIFTSDHTGSRPLNLKIEASTFLISRLRLTSIVFYTYIYIERDAFFYIFITSWFISQSFGCSSQHQSARVSLFKCLTFCFLSTNLLVGPVCVLFAFLQPCPTCSRRRLLQSDKARGKRHPVPEMQSLTPNIDPVQRGFGFAFLVCFVLFCNPKSHVNSLVLATVLRRSLRVLSISPTPSKFFHFLPTEAQYRQSFCQGMTRFSTEHCEGFLCRNLLRNASASISFWLCLSNIVALVCMH